MPNLSSEVTRAALAVVLAASSAFAGAPAPAPKRVVTLWPDVPAQPATTSDLLEVGERVYKGACLGCHGEKGDGLGREGKFLAIPPRDFTTGQFIIRSTPLGTLPWDTDLFGSIRRGFRPGVGMPAFTFLSDREVWGVIAYLKTFSPRFKTEKPGAKVDLPPVPADLASLAPQGQGVFMSGGACFVCHGMQGKGDGPAAPGLVYVSGKHLGKKVSPANLHRADWFKGGRRPEDVFRAISTGLDGTPMPGFAASLSVEQRWSLTAFIMSLNPPAPPAGTPGAVP
jgi:mono/diheme cytochrome c family protein